jgi:hypothetical protein
MSGADRWSSNGREEYTPGFGHHKTTSPIPIPPSSTHRQRRRSPSPHSSTSSGSYSDDRSHASFASSASTAPSLNPPPPMNPINYGYEYPCSFGFAGCGMSYHPTRINDWISHEASHFLRHRPPPKACCTFCDRVFENHTDRELSWSQRMNHIAGHFQRFERQEHPRPDFFVIDYMLKKGLLTAEEHKALTRYTERPRCDGLVDIGYKTPEMRRKEEKSKEQRYDLEKEDRQRRRARKRR